MENRYIKNPFKEEPPVEIEKDIGIALESTLSLHEKYYPMGSTYALNSKGAKKINSSLYCGAGGNIYLYYKLSEYHAKSDKSLSQAYLEKAFTALNANFIAYDKEESLNQVPSFYMGPPGLFALGVLIYKRLKDIKSAKQCFNTLLEFIEICDAPDGEDDVLYGVAGYLHALMLVDDSSEFTTEAVVNKAFSILIKNGISTATKLGNKFLTYTFPRSKGKQYLGAAHGTMGVLYALICACLKYKSINDKAKDKAMIYEACMEILKIQFPNGNFPSTYKSTKDELVHFCHGATGGVFLFTKAYELFKEKIFLECAIKAGNAVWERGLLLKGNGLCHGITGNGYALNALFKATNDQLWRKRCLMFAVASYSDNIQLPCKNYVDPTRKAVGLPDTPYSLMEGCGGTICFYIDLLGEPQQMMLPGFELN